MDIYAVDLAYESVELISEKKPVRFLAQQRLFQWTIYIWDDIEKHIKKPLLFHEIVEVCHVVSGMDGTLAHNATLLWEKRFCSDNLTDSHLEDYLLFKKEHGYDGFEPSSR